MADVAGFVVATMIVASMVALVGFAIAAVVAVILSWREARRVRELARELDHVLESIVGPRSATGASSDSARRTIPVARRRP